MTTTPGSILILAGPPGAGKSTVARRIATSYRLGVHLHTDDFWDYISAGAIPPYLPESDAQNQTVMSVIAGAALTYARGGFDVVVDGIVGPWMLDHFQEIPAEVALNYVILRPDRGETLARAVARTEEGALTEETPVVAMWDQFRDVGELESHVLDSTGESVDTTVNRVSVLVASGAVRLR